MPPIFSGLHDSTLNSTQYEPSRDLLSQFSSISRRLGLARDAESASAITRSLTKVDRLLRRQNDGSSGLVPDSHDGPSPGAVVGIVLGSVFGFLLILWLIWTCSVQRDTIDEEIIRTRRPSHSRRAEKVVEIERPPRRPGRVVIEKRRGSLIDSSSSDSDIIIGTVRRQGSSREQPRNGIRYLNPDLPAGGNGHIEEVFVRKGSGSRRSRR